MSASELLLDVLIKAAPPAITGVGGVVISVWRMTRTFAKRIDRLEEQRRKMFGTTELMGQTVNELQRQTDRAENRVISFEKQLSTTQEELERINETLISFIKEQNDQWQEMNRTLGRLEGYLKGRASTHD